MGWFIPVHDQVEKLWKEVGTLLFSGTFKQLSTNTFLQWVLAGIMHDIRYQARVRYQVIFQFVLYLHLISPNCQKSGSDRIYSLLLIHYLHLLPPVQLTFSLTYFDSIYLVLFFLTILFQRTSEFSLI